MIIDIASHVYPESVKERIRAIAPNFGSMGSRIDNTRQLYDFDTRFRLMDEVGEYTQIISLSSPPIEELASPEEGAEIARMANDSMAELVSRHADRFAGFVASLSLKDMDSAIDEIDRAINQLGASGVQVFTDVGGRALDEADFDPLFASMAAHGLPIWLHPTRTPDMPDFAAEDKSSLDIWLILGWPFATAAAMMRLVAAGLFERHVGVKIITHHMGGMVPFHAERVEGALYRLSLQGGDGGAGPYMRRPPGELLRMFYADTAMHGAVDGTRCGLAYFGANNTLFGTDCPFGNIRKGIDMIDRLGLDQVSRQKIMADNACRLLGATIDK